MDEPTRLLDDPDVSPELRADLRRAAEATPPAFDPSLGAERLDAAIQSGAAGSIAGSALPWVGAALAVLLGGFGLWSLQPTAITPREAPAPETTSAADSAADADSDADGDADSDAVADADADSDAVAAADAVADSDAVADPDPVAEPARGSEPRARRPGPRASRGATREARADDAPPVDTLQEEMRLIARARRSLASSPAAALDAAEEHRRRFPGGLFAEEREALAVLSLARLGRQAEAERRGQRFLRSHPAGTFSERVRRAIGGAE